ncbi:MAG TPA: hypothetical protein VJ246_01330 [Patescibacteria group bacterium]|nr:hypothetical protein [Patescibacteria group bacterium]
MTNYIELHELVTIDQNTADSFIEQILQGASVSEQAAICILAATDKCPARELEKGDPKCHACQYARDDQQIITNLLVDNNVRCEMRSDAWREQRWLEVKQNRRKASLVHQACQISIK